MFMRSKKEKEEEYEGDGEDFVSLQLSGHAKRSIVAIVLFVVSLLFILGFFNAAGIAGVKMTAGVGKIFGWGKYIAPFVFAFAGFVLLRKKVDTQFYVTKIIGISFAFWGFLALLHLLPFEQDQYAKMAQGGVGGGYVGYVLAHLLVAFMGKIAGTVVLIAVILVGLIVAFNMSFVGMSDRVSISKPEHAWMFWRKKKDDESEDDDNETTDPEESQAEIISDDYVSDDDLDDADFDDEEYHDIQERSAISAPVFVGSAHQKAQEIIDQKMSEHVRTLPRDVDWELPPLKLLKKGGEKAQCGDVKQRAARIEETFANFGITMELDDIVTGPTVTQYSFRPQSGVKLSRITALNADLALALAAHPIRIEAPIPGKSFVGIEVPNKSPAIVRMRDLLNTDEFSNPNKKLLLALGEDVNGDYVFENLSKMPHLLVAGTTGSGKSVTINCILLSLLYKNSPDDLRLILVDPKHVELTLYNGIPHLLADVIVDNSKVINALKWAVSEMERRYKLLEETGSRDLASYGQKRETGGVRSFIDPDTGQRCEEEMENLPAIVIVIDELSDLMSSHGKEVEGVIVRLAQKSRAVGIHLVISTQRPSVEVITGLIKANLPARIALKVATNIDSRTIIDVPGAEKLVGNGDLLFVSPQSSTPHRLQSAFVEEEEVKKVVNFIKRQAQSVGAYAIDEDFMTDGSSGKISGGAMTLDLDQGSSMESNDPLYAEVKELVIETGKASTSYIQRRLRIGYSRAARLVDELESNGVVGPAEGSRGRRVLTDNHNNSVEVHMDEDV
jgi:S-DNA-T family DNA segregation ATPase FtsK/SpoIIIE